MMMIAFITFYSSLVPLIEGRRACKIPNREFIFFRIHSKDDFSKVFCPKIRLQFLVWTRCFRRASSWVEFDFCFANKNSLRDWIFLPIV